MVTVGQHLFTFKHIILKSVIFLKGVEIQSPLQSRDRDRDRDPETLVTLRHGDPDRKSSCGSQILVTRRKPVTVQLAIIVSVSESNDSDHIFTAVVYFWLNISSAELISALATRSNTFTDSLVIEKECYIILSFIC